MIWHGTVVYYDAASTQDSYSLTRVGLIRLGVDGVNSLPVHMSTSTVFTCTQTHKAHEGEKFTDGRPGRGINDGNHDQGGQGTNGKRGRISQRSHRSTTGLGEGRWEGG